MDHAYEVLKFWFGPKPYTPARLDERMAFWFGTTDTREVLAQKDQEISERFGTVVDRAAAGDLNHWADSPRQRLALILLLDQFPRHVYRGSAKAYASDTRAAQLALEGMQIAADAALAPVERIFFYMPLQHAEVLELQEESVTAARRLLAEAPEGTTAHFMNMLRFAELHRDIVVEHGRFPHRDAALGRQATAAEIKYSLSGSK